MIWATIGILTGIIIGLSINYNIPIEYIKYTAVIIIGIIDSLFHTIKTKNNKENQNSILFVTELITNIILAIAITFLGEQLGLELYLAATVVFTFRIFKNIEIIRKNLIIKYFNKIKS